MNWILNCIIINTTGGKYLYTEHPIHTTVTGNNLVADVLIEKFIKPIYQASLAEDDDKLLYKVPFKLRMELESR